MARHFEEQNFYVYCSEDLVPFTLSYQQYKWLLFQEDPILMFAPPGNNKRVVFRGNADELKQLLRENADEIAQIYVEDYIEYIHDADGTPGDVPVACNGNWVLYVPMGYWIKVLERMKGVYTNWPRTTYEFKGEKIPHCGESPQGLINLISRICNVDLPDFEDLAEIPDPSDEDYESRMSTVERKVESVGYALETYFNTLRRAAPRRYKHLPDKIAR